MKKLVLASLGLSMAFGCGPATESDAAAGNQSDAATTAYSGYVMAYFTESPSGNADNYGLHLAVSSDSLNWTPLNQNNPVATPTEGTLGLRDPFILRKQDGTFVILATDLYGTNWSEANQYIHVWSSTDLRTFTNYHRVKLHSMATHSWAPEAFWDASRGQYAIIYSAVNDSSGHDVIMVNYTTDFTTVTTAEVFFDPGYAVIDGDVIVGTSGTNYMYFKDSAACTLVGTQSTSLDPGSFSIYTSAISHGGIEAPILVPPLSGSTWYLWGDTWSPNGVFYAWQTSSISGGSWTAMDQKNYSQPLNSKHGTIQPITATEMSNLIAYWGSPTWNRIKSYNYPARYVRHASNVGRIDAYAFDPYQDQMWKIVPGLADSNGISFQSVNYPTMYLRQSSYKIVLNASDGTSTFNNDATFYKTSGFADSSWTSFWSYSYPTRYIRHYSYVLQIDPITSSSSTTDKQDATFKIQY